MRGYREKTVRKGIFKMPGIVRGKWDMTRHISRNLRGINA